MNKKIALKRPLKNPPAVKEELAYWLSKTPDERLAAVDCLRKQYYGAAEGLLRVVRVTKRTQRCVTNRGRQRLAFHGAPDSPATRTFL